MYSTRHRNGLCLCLLVASVCLPLLFSQTQDQASLKKSSRSWLDPTVKEIYKKWLREDVAWIISDQERSDYTKLSTDKQRDNFVIEFWERRNPIPGSSENTFKERHYQHLAYANSHFAAGVPGWETDRGRIYIMFGPPDMVEHHYNMTSPEAPRQPGSHHTSNFDQEVWRYAYIDGIGKDVTFEFIDSCRCGDYHMLVHSLENNSPGIKESFPQP